MRKLWNHLRPIHSVITREQIADLREQTDYRKRTEDISRERGVDIQLRATAQRCYQEDATDPMVAPQDYDVRQSGSVLELQKTSGNDQQIGPGTFLSS